MMWLCEWCAIYGKFPTSEAFRPDSEEPVLTQDDQEICHACAAKYYKTREEAAKECNADTDSTQARHDSAERAFNWSRVGDSVAGGVRQDRH